MLGFAGWMIGDSVGVQKAFEVAAAKARYYPTRASTLRLVFSLWPKQTLRIHQWPFYVSQSYQ